MDSTKARRLRRYLRLSYPLHVVCGNDAFHGAYPDLPGCTAHATALPALYAQLELQRREWLTEQVLRGAPIAAPNSSLPAVASGAASGRATAELPGRR